MANNFDSSYTLNCMHWLSQMMLKSNNKNISCLIEKNKSYMQSKR